MNPKITILMALYNGGEYLERSVKSVLDQTYKEFEFLIIDDCSTDCSLDVIESFGDARIKIYRNTTNLGQTKSLNIGLKMASGEYVARMDADDIAFPFWLEKQLESVQDHPNHSVISAYVTAIDEHDKTKKVYKPAVNVEDLILRSFFASPINHVGSIFKKKDILDCGGYDEQYKTAADYAQWGKLLRVGKKITTTEQFLVAIREHTSSISHLARGKSELAEIIDIAQKNISAFATIKMSSVQIEKMCRAFYLPDYLTAEEFDCAIQGVQAIYKNLISSLEIQEGKAFQWSRQQIRVLYVKRIFSLIEQKNYSLVKQAASNGIKTFGYTSIFMFIFIFSFLGQIVLSLLPKIHKMILKRKAYLQLDKKLFG